MNAKHEFEMTPYSVEGFVADSYSFHSALEIKSKNHSTHLSNDIDEVTIQRFCSMICAGMSSPFPRSQDQLAFAVIGLKNALKKMSFTELGQRRPEVSSLDIEQLRSEQQPIEELSELLDQKIFKQALPNLRQAVRFMHEQDQLDVYYILSQKLGGIHKLTTLET